MVLVCRAVKTDVCPRLAAFRLSLSLFCKNPHELVIYKPDGGRLSVTQHWPAASRLIFLQRPLLHLIIIIKCSPNDLKRAFREIVIDVYLLFSSRSREVRRSGTGDEQLDDKLETGNCHQMTTRRICLSKMILFSCSRNMYYVLMTDINWTSALTTTSVI